MTHHTLATCILLAALPLAASAADSAQDMSRTTGQATTSQTDASSMFKELDSNQDGKISQSEARRSADVNARFSTLDNNKDKQISQAEWQSGEKSPSRGAAGSTGESHEQGSMRSGQGTGSSDTGQASPSQNKSGY